MITSIEGERLSKPTWPHVSLIAGCASLGGPSFSQSSVVSGGESLEERCCWASDHRPAAEPKRLVVGYSSGFYDREQSSSFHKSQPLIQVLKQQSKPRPLHYHHHVSLFVCF